ncbi:MAG TPA: methylmalonyl Co-A mutase-associated GTPase MeaB [Thermoplasmata archaeon]|nr:methylmalonyl Co-A mutase-associated GTPase MeaB [Thermoplasmata archaeon]
MKLVEQVLKGDKRAVAKLISMVEDDDPGATEALASVYPKTGKAHVVGFTGPPGVGKSSLINRLVREFRSRGKKVGVVAVDPTSPFTGGAVLGDRIRMADTGTDPGVFIRSMATRGHAGGLALATFDAVKVLDAFGMDIVFVETVGAGQSEVEVASRAHTTVVVQMPQSGDAVQVLKAGILEIGDVYVVNKTDLGGADVMATNLQFMVDEKEGWRAPVAKTSALEGKGIPELADAIERHHKHLRSGPLWERRESDRARKELLESMRRLLAETFSEKGAGEAFESNVKSIVARRIDPRTAAANLLHDLPRLG